MAEIIEVIHRESNIVDAAMIEIVEVIRENPSDVDDKEDHADCIPWYHGKISNEITYKLLQSNKDGLFLVRDSLKHLGDFSLCLTFSNRFFDYRIVRDIYGRLTINYQDYFDTLEDIIEACRQRRRELCCYLVEYVVRDVKKEVIADINVDYIRKGVFGKAVIGHIQERKVLLAPVDDHVSIYDIVQKNLCHENLVNIMGLALTDKIGKYNMITVHVQHETLLSLLRTFTKRPYIVRYAFNFCYDICMGMEYLERKQLCHQFLAARNVWITNTGLAKLANFGICNEYLGRFRHFPYRHVAPEVLIAKKHSIQADMWSFGVVLWEIYSHGDLPYFHIPFSKILKFLRANNRLNIPTKNCPRFVRKIIPQCWRWKPEDRPVFSHLRIIFNEHRLPIKDRSKFLNF